MAQIEFRVKGIEELTRRFADMSSRLPAAMGEAMSETVDIIHERLSGYTQDIPPKPEGSTYERTFELQESIGKGWTEMRDKIVGWVTTDLDYAPFVIGEGKQAEIHQGRWYTEQEIADEVFPEAERLFVEATKRVVRESAK